jgi:hypothetical protein
MVLGTGFALGKSEVIVIELDISILLAIELLTRDPALRSFEALRYAGPHPP